MKRIMIIVCLGVMIISCTALIPDFTTDPAISPDGNQICFVYDGDLWLVPFQGGSAKRLTATGKGMGSSLVSRWETDSF